MDEQRVIGYGTTFVTRFLGPFSWNVHDFDSSVSH
jgi:hypothetical protein